MGHAEKCRHPGGDQRTAYGSPAKAKTVALARPCAEDVNYRLQKQVLRCRPQGKQRRPGGTQLRWIDVLNRDLAELPN